MNQCLRTTLYITQHKVPSSFFLGSPCAENTKVLLCCLDSITGAIHLHEQFTDHGVTSLSLSLSLFALSLYLHVYMYYVEREAISMSMAVSCYCSSLEALSAHGEVEVSHT